MKRHPQLRQVLGQHVLRKSGLLLIEVHRNNFKADGRTTAQMQQDVEQRITVLAARQANHHLVTIADHVKVGDRLADQPAQPFGKLVGFV